MGLLHGGYEVRVIRGLVNVMPRQGAPALPARSGIPETWACFTATIHGSKIKDGLVRVGTHTEVVDDVPLLTGPIGCR